MRGRILAQAGAVVHARHGGGPGPARDAAGLAAVGSRNGASVSADSVALLMAIVAVLAAFLLTVVPVVVPGTLLVPAGALVAGLIGGFDALPWWSWVVQAVLVSLYLLVDNIVQALGVRRIGASGDAMVGGAIGVFAGPLALAWLGPLGVVLGAPAGAVAGTLAGELVHRRRRNEPPPQGDVHLGRLGVTAIVAWVAGTVLKLVVVAVQAALLIALLVL